MSNAKKLISIFLVLALVFSFMLTACKETGTNPESTPAVGEGGGNSTDPSNGGSGNGNGGGSTDTTNPSGGNEPTNPQPDVPAADMEITVMPPEMEIYAGEEIELLFGVTVNNSQATLIIIDDDDFDNETPGTYTITYQAAVGDVKKTATRVITVLEALSDLALEVRANNLGENKWKGKYLNFKNAEYVQLTGNAEQKGVSGVFHNTTNASVVLSVTGNYGCAAILDKNGVVIEGRDGANSKLVNANNPTRAGSTTTTIGSDSVSKVFAMKMTIPAGGFAVVVQANYAGTTADTDGRGFMNYNVIYQVGNVVRLFWVDSNEELTTYVNQAPTVAGNTQILVKLNDSEFDLDTAVVTGLTIKDDKGTFKVEDDVTLTEITILDRDGFDVGKEGTYTIEMKVSDGKLTTTFTREVKVSSSGVGTLNIGDNHMNIATELVATNKDLSAVGNYAYLIYTSAYNKGINFANGYGEAIVMNKYGQIVRIYDGANGKYYDKNNTSGVVDTSKCTAAGYVTEAYNSLQSGETLLVAPNSTANNAEGGSRKFLLNNRTIGALVSGLGMTFEELPDEDPCENGHDFVNGECTRCEEADPNYDPCANGHDFVNGECTRCEEPDPNYVPPANNKTITIGTKTPFTATEGKWAYNDASVVASNAASYSMIIYDKSYTGTVSLNGYGAAIVLDKYGTLVKIYDGANGQFWTKDGKASGTLSFTTSNYATVAFSELAEGELLIVFPNDGGSNPARGWALGLRNAPNGPSECGQIATLTGFTFETKPTNDKTITIGDKTFTAVEGKWAYNDASVVASNVATYKMVIYDKNYTGTVSLNGYGAAIVLDKYGTLVKIYDGANGGFYTKDGKASGTLSFTTSNYATVAFSELAEGELLIVFPNDGTNAADSARTFALSLRNVGGDCYCGQTATLTGFTFQTKS